MDVVKNNNYENKTYAIVEQLNKMNIDDIIIEDLSNYGFNVEDENIKYLKNIIKKFVVRYKLFTREKAINMLINNSNYLYSYSEEERNKEKIGLRNVIHSNKHLHLILNGEIFDGFVISCADRVNNSITNNNKILQKKYNNK